MFVLNWGFIIDLRGQYTRINDTTLYQWPCECEEFARLTFIRHT